MATYTVRPYRGAYKHDAQEVRVSCADGERPAMEAAARAAGWDSPGWSEPGSEFGCTSDHPAKIHALVTELRKAGASMA